MPRWARISLLLAPAMLVVGVFFVAGVAQALAQSFGYQPYLPGWQLSLDAYRQLFQDPAVRASLVLTLLIGGGQVETLPMLLFAAIASSDTTAAAAVAVLVVVPPLALSVVTARSMTRHSAATIGFGRL